MISPGSLLAIFCCHEVAPWHQKIVMKVNIHCKKCKTQVLKAVSKLEGISQVSLSVEKQTLIVVGDVDPVCVTKQVRKIGKVVEIVTVGPPKPPDSVTEDLAQCCRQCQFVAVYEPYNSNMCTIL